MAEPVFLLTDDYPLGDDITGYEIYSFVASKKQEERHSVVAGNIMVVTDKRYDFSMSTLENRCAAMERFAMCRVSGNYSSVILYIKDKTDKYDRVWFASASLQIPDIYNRLEKFALDNNISLAVSLHLFQKNSPPHMHIIYNPSHFNQLQECLGVLKS